MKRLTALAAGAVIALSLSGCMRVQADFVLNEDDTVNLDMIMAIEDATIEELGLSADDFLGQMDTELGDDLFMPGMEREEYKQDGHTGYQYSSDDAPLAVVSDEVMSFTREGDEYVVSGQLENEDMGFTETDIADFEAFGMSEPDITFSVTFPGEVTDSNGVIDGNKVTWTYVLGETLEFDARGSAGGSGSSGGSTDEATDDATDEATDGATEGTDAPSDEPADAASDSDDEGVNWLLWGGIGLGALVLAGLAAWLIARNRKGGGQGGPGGPGGPGAYAAAGAPAWGQQPGQQGQQQWGQQPGQGQQWGQPDQQGQQQWGQQPGQQQPGQPGQQWGQQPSQQQPGQQWGQPGQQQPGQQWGQPDQQGQQQWGQQQPGQPGQQQPGQEQWGQPGTPDEQPPAPDQQPWR